MNEPVLENITPVTADYEGGLVIILEWLEKKPAFVLP